MERLCDIRSRRLIISCSPCRRLGSYCLDRLRQRFGEHASLYEVYVRLTQTCRYQYEVGARQPNQYGRACRAQVDTDDTARSGALPSRT
ncbi:hypothetical protein MTDSW087_05566 [Methylobacterium dankookense]|uniref:Uncharacterized protein n=1 Tax=Methylobacterium dankookense TaxID=560405 RepID=A0A564G7A1_9HYPH|nr:hypothetical protein IFDJLNFL_5371 [Methylobacterium dankookense]VUF15818.1 hypothetical protein MTDSW087_05566 [Methylobacterium dankookense]